MDRKTCINHRIIDSNKVEMTMSIEDNHGRYHPHFFADGDNSEVTSVRVMMVGHAAVIVTIITCYVDNEVGEGSKRFPPCVAGVFEIAHTGEIITASDAMFDFVEKIVSEEE